MNSSIINTLKKLQIKSIAITLILTLLLISNYLYAQSIRRITITNNCNQDLLWTNENALIIKNGNFLLCEPEKVFCDNDAGICGQDGLCYYKNPAIVFGQDDKPDYYLRSKSTKIYDVKLVNNSKYQEYILNLIPQIQCVNSDSGYICKSANCNRDHTNPTNGNCIIGKKISPPYNKASIYLRDKINDEYYVSLESGINLPISIKPIADSYGNQDLDNNFFCKPAGLTNCNWDFIPPSQEPFKAHVFNQIDRDIDADVTALCQSNDDCEYGQKCGLKYPEDLIGYTGSGYCGNPIGYYNPITFCKLNFTSNELKKIFNCQINNKDQDSSVVIYNEQDSVIDRCPENSFEIGIKDLDGSTQQFCIQDLYNCSNKTVKIGDKEYSYLDSCYNSTFNQPESSVCCGCIDWPGIKSNSKKLCMREPSSVEPNPCSVDFANSPPDCKADLNTTVHSPNPLWLKFVKPSLEWLVKGCNDGKEYKYGDNHSVYECSTEDDYQTNDNNVNYLITFCPEGYNLFDIKQKSTSDIPNFNIKSIEKPTPTSRFAGEITLFNIIVICLFLLISIILVVYFFTKREK